MIYWEAVKDPDDHKDYGLDWSAYLQSETIVSSQWILPDGITKQSESHTGTKAIVWLSGGTAGCSYLCTNRITTSGGRQQDETAELTVRQR